MAKELHILKNGLVLEIRCLEDGVYRIGRDASADIVLADAAVSKTHALLTIEQDRLIIKDAGSSNGIFHGGKKITEQTFTNRFDIDIKPFILRSADAEPPENHSKAINFLDKLKAIGLANTRASLFVLIFSIMLLTLLIGYLPLKSQAASAQRRESLKTGVLLGRYLAEMNRPFLADDNRALVRTAPVSEEDGVIYAVVVDADGRIIAPPEKQGDFFKWDGLAQAFKGGKLAVSDGPQNEKIIFYPVRQQANALGAAIVGFAGGQTAGLGMGAAGYFLLTILCCLSMLVAYAMARVFLSPLTALNEQVEVAIKEGRGSIDFDAPYTELGHLKRSFDRLLIRKPASAQPPTQERGYPAPAAAKGTQPKTAAPSPTGGATSAMPRLDENSGPWCVIDRETYTIQKISGNFNKLLGAPERREGMHVIEAFDADMIQAVSHLMETDTDESQTLALENGACTIRRIHDPARQNHVILIFEVAQ